MIRSRAAVAWAPGQPLEVTEIDVAPPHAGEVLLRVVATGVCHTDAYTLSGADPEGLFPAVLGHEGGAIVMEIGPFTRRSAAAANSAAQARPTSAKRSGPPRARG